MEKTVPDLTLDYNVYQPFDSEDDFSEAAYFALERYGALEEPIELNLLVHNVAMAITENSQMKSHLGETFSLFMYGKSPTMATVQATLVDAQQAPGKNMLFKAYRDFLRPTAVARTGVMPVLVLPMQQIHGPVQTMHLTASGDRHGVWSVSFEITVLKYTIFDTDGNITFFDYTTGEDVQIRYIKTQTTVVKKAEENEPRTLDSGDTVYTSDNNYEQNIYAWS